MLEAEIVMKIKWGNYFYQSLLGAGLTTTVIYTLAANQNHPDRPVSITTNDQNICEKVVGSEQMIRTELFLGLRKPNGSEVNQAKFQHFLDREVTPRFPDGFTLLTGQGQFKNASGAILPERSKLLILLYPVATNSSQQIEQIRKAYVSAFQQQAVLRADELSCASF
jgi:Protein of unknown function (DUF3574)